MILQPLPPILPIMVDLTEISTPREALLAVKPGKPDAQVLKQAMDAHFQQLPVLTEDNGLAGLVPVTKLAEMVGTGEAISADKAKIKVPAFNREVSLEEFVTAMRDHGAVVHNALDGDGHDPTWFGLVTMADLNRAMFRSYVYRLIATLEGTLGQLIMDEFADDWGAIRLLSDGTQGRIRDFYEEEKRDGVEISPIMNVTLSDLLYITRESNNVWKLLGYRDPDELNDISHQINELRNRIMHPVRPLIVVHDDVETLYAGVMQMSDIIQRVLKQTGKVAR